MGKTDEDDLAVFYLTDISHLVSDCTHSIGLFDSILHFLPTPQNCNTFSDRTGYLWNRGASFSTAADISIPRHGPPLLLTPLLAELATARPSAASLVKLGAQIRVKPFFTAGTLLETMLKLHPRFCLPRPASYTLNNLIFAFTKFKSAK